MTLEVPFNAIKLSGVYGIFKSAKGAQAPQGHFFQGARCRQALKRSASEALNAES